MNGNVLVLMFWTSSCMVVSAQESGVSLSTLKEKNVCWMGLDFSVARMVGSDFFDTGDDISSALIPAWNKFFVDDPGKFDIESAFNLKKLSHCTAACNKRNTELDAGALVQVEPYALDERDIQNVLSGYDFSVMQGDVGILFVVESFDKKKGLATIWVNVIDIKAGKAILTRQLQGEPGGMGLRNYWANAVYNVIMLIKGKWYKKWCKEMEG